MAACTDPQGAVWCPFRPSNAPAVQDTASRAPGDFIWVELLSKQPEDAALHYADLLGYTVETMDMGAMGLYRVLKVGEVGIGGVMPMPPDAAAPPQWLPYGRAVDAGDQTAIDRSHRATNVLTVAGAGLALGGAGLAISGVL